MVTVPTSPLVRRLARCSCLTPQDIAVFTGAFEGRTRRLGPRREIVADGEARPIVSAIVSGWAARARTLEDGRRQIVGLLLPGDFCDLHTGLVGWMDHSVVSLTPVTVLDIPRARITRLREAAPRLTRCLIREFAGRGFAGPRMGGQSGPARGAGADRPSDVRGLRPA